MYRFPCIGRAYASGAFNIKNWGGQYLELRYLVLKWKVHNKSWMRSSCASGTLNIKSWGGRLPELPISRVVAKGVYSRVHS